MWNLTLHWNLKFQVSIFFDLLPLIFFHILFFRFMQISPLLYPINNIFSRRWELWYNTGYDYIVCTQNQYSES